MLRRAISMVWLAAPALWGQCVMCGRTAAAQNEARIQVLQQGIMILLIPPVLILSGFLYLLWRRRA